MSEQPRSRRQMRAAIFGKEALVDGIDACLVGGREFAQMSLAFMPPSNGNDPNAALAFAACRLARRGGMPASSAEPA